jgi:hypothetical protein
MGAWLDSLSPEDRAKHEQEENEVEAIILRNMLGDITDFLETAKQKIQQELPSSRQNSIAVTKIEEAILWLQKDEKSC